MKILIFLIIILIFIFKKPKNISNFANNKYNIKIDNVLNELKINKDYKNKNKIYKLDQNSELISIGKSVYKENILLEKNAANSFFKMRDDAKKNNIDLTFVSGYRTFDKQKKIFLDRLKKNSFDVVIKTVKVPGFSQHHTGRAIDFISNLKNFEYSKQFKWLKQNANKYGFYLSYGKNNKNMYYEPWHWFYK